MGTHISNNTVDDSLVFHMDLGDYTNGFPSMPRQNMIDGIWHSYGGLYDGTGFQYRGGEGEVDIPKVGRTYAKWADYWNNYNNGGSGATCCPNLFYYHDGSYIEGIEGNTAYTYSIIYKHTLGYTHPNFMYRYEYNSSGTTLTEGGLHSTSRRTHLGDGWYHAWGTWTTRADTVKLRGFSFLYNYTQYGRYYVAGVSIIKGSHILAPKQMLAPREEKTSTTAILDLTGNKSITVPDAAFNGEAQMEYDGTNFANHAHLTDGDWQVVEDQEDWTMEHIVYYNSVPAGYNNTTSPACFFGSDSVADNNWYWAVLSSKLALWNISPGYWRYGSTTLQAGRWYHIAIKCYQSGARYQMYLNGEPEGGDHQANIWTQDRSGLRVKTIGAGNSSNRRTLNGRQPITKIYTRALSDAEIKSNYEQYKSRFNF